MCIPHGEIYARLKKGENAIKCARVTQQSNQNVEDLTAAIAKDANGFLKCSVSGVSIAEDSRIGACVRLALTYTATLVQRSGTLQRIGQTEARLERCRRTCCVVCS